LRVRVAETNANLRPDSYHRPGPEARFGSARDAAAREGGGVHPPALFGFQLVAVFSAGFPEKLTRSEQLIHLGAIALTAIAVALIMTPAALHRAMGSQTVTKLFVHVSSRLLLLSMFPLALSVSLEFYLIARVIVGGNAVTLFAIALFAIFAMLWFVLPEARGLQRRIGGSRHDPRDASARECERRE
jgi:hypothetical protein